MDFACVCLEWILLLCAFYRLDICLACPSCDFEHEGEARSGRRQATEDRWYQWWAALSGQYLYPWTTGSHQRILARRTGTRQAFNKWSFRCDYSETPLYPNKRQGRHNAVGQSWLCPLRITAISYTTWATPLPSLRVQCAVIEWLSCPGSGPSPPFVHEWFF